MFYVNLIFEAVEQLGAFALKAQSVEKWLKVAPCTPAFPHFLNPHIWCAAVRVPLCAIYKSGHGKSIYKRDKMVHQPHWQLPGTTYPNREYNAAQPPWIHCARHSGGWESAAERIAGGGGHLQGAPQGATGHVLQHQPHLLGVPHHVQEAHNLDVKGGRAHAGGHPGRHPSGFK